MPVSAQQHNSVNTNQHELNSKKAFKKKKCYQGTINNMDGAA